MSFKTETSIRMFVCMAHYVRIGWVSQPPFHNPTRVCKPRFTIHEHTSHTLWSIWIVLTNTDEYCATSKDTKTTHSFVFSDYHLGFVRTQCYQGAFVARRTFNVF